MWFVWRVSWVMRHTNSNLALTNFVITFFAAVFFLFILPSLFFIFSYNERSCSFTGIFPSPITFFLELCKPTP